MLIPTHLFLVTVTPTPPGIPSCPTAWASLSSTCRRMTIASTTTTRLICRGLRPTPRPSWTETHSFRGRPPSGMSSPLWTPCTPGLTPAGDSLGHARPSLVRCGGVGEYTRVLRGVADWSARAVRRPGFDFSDPRDAHTVWLARSLADNGVDDRNFVGLGGFPADHSTPSRRVVSTPMCTPAAWWNYWHTARELGLEIAK